MAKRWIGAAVAKMKKKGTVGSFSRAAKRSGMSTSEKAASVLKKGSKASTAMKRRALFARNVAKSRHR